MDDKAAWKQLLPLLALLSIMGIGMFGALAVFNQPTIDDFWYTWMVKKYGFWEAQHQWYITINARYSSNAFMSFNSFVWGSVLFFKAFPILLMVGYVALFSLFAKKILFPGFSNREAMYAGLFLAAVYCYGMPGFYEGFYWSSALMGYQVPFLLWGFGLLFLLANTKPVSVAGTLFWALFILVLSGFHELMALHITVVMAFVLWKKSPVSKGKTRLLLIALVGAASSLLFQVISAGNLHKAQITAEKTSSYDYYLLVLPLLQFAYHLVRASLLNPLFILMVVFIRIISRQPSFRLPPMMKINGKEMLLGTLLVLLLATGPVYLVGQIEGTKTPLRVINFSFGILFAWFVYVAFWIIGQKKSANINHWKTSNWMNATAIITVFCLTIFLKGKPVVAPLMDGSARIYNTQVKNRFETIEKSVADTTLISCLDAQPLTLCPVDVCNDPTLLGYLEKVFNKSIVIRDSLSSPVPLP